MTATGIAEKENSIESSTFLHVIGPESLEIYNTFTWATDGDNMKLDNIMEKFKAYEGGSICNENPFITPSTNALRFNAICQTKDQSFGDIFVHEKLFYLSKFSKLQTFEKAH